MILGHREIVEQREMLEHHADAAPARGRTRPSCGPPSASRKALCSKARVPLPSAEIQEAIKNGLFGDSERPARRNCAAPQQGERASANCYSCLLRFLPESSAGAWPGT